MLLSLGPGDKIKMSDQWWDSENMEWCEYVTGAPFEFIPEGCTPICREIKGGMVATRWFKNGDHPEDDCEIFDGSDGKQFQGEGKVVRYFRHPGIPGGEICNNCGHLANEHGWIDQGELGQVVCPGDIIIKNEKDEWEAFHPVHRVTWGDCNE